MPNVYTTTLVKYMYCTFCILLVVQPCCLKNASTTSECTFSSLRRLKTYVRSTMNQNRLNNCLLLHCHKSITDTLDTVDIARRSLFVQMNNAEDILENTSRLEVCAWLFVQKAPPPPPCFKTLSHLCFETSYVFRLLFFLFFCVCPFSHFLIFLPWSSQV